MYPVFIQTGRKSVELAYGFVHLYGSFHYYYE